MADDKDNDDIESMQEGAAQEAKDRDDAKDSLKEHDAEKGENPDSEADIDAARKDADWLPRTTPIRAENLPSDR